MEPCFWQLYIAQYHHDVIYTWIANKGKTLINIIQTKFQTSSSYHRLIVSNGEYYNLTMRFHYDTYNGKTRWKYT